MSGSKTIIVQAGIRVTDPKKFMSRAKEVVEQTRCEAGCIRYDLLQDILDANSFYFIEEYADEAAYKAHREMPYMAPFREFRETVLDRYLGLRQLSDI